MKFEMADSENPQQLIKASQAAVLGSLETVLAKIKAEEGGVGLTWEQIDFIVQTFKKKEPTIIMQERPL